MNGTATRTALGRRTVLAAALATPAVRVRAQTAGPFWPGGARLALSVTMMMEADGDQPELAQPGPTGTPQASQRFPNHPIASMRRYGAIEGIPRLLDLFDRQGIRVSSFMIGASIDAHPEVGARWYAAVTRAVGAAAHMRRSSTCRAPRRPRSCARASRASGAPPASGPGVQRAQAPIRAEHAVDPQ